MTEKIIVYKSVSHIFGKIYQKKAQIEAKLLICRPVQKKVCYKLFR